MPDGYKPGFLDKVKVKQFSQSVKTYRKPSNKTLSEPFREIQKIKNRKPDQVFTVIGVTSLKEGWSDYIGPEEGYSWEQTASKQVFIIASSLGRRYKAAAEDLEPYIPEIIQPKEWKSPNPILRLLGLIKIFDQNKILEPEFYVLADQKDLEIETVDELIEALQDEMSYWEP